MSFISEPMGWILAQLSKLFNGNFAGSVLIFTILVNIVMLPLTLKSQKSTAKQAKVKHKLDALKKKYGDDRQKYSMAMQELYNKEGISMGGGCMPMIVRFILMMGVYYAIMSPFSYVANIDKTAINAAKEWVSYVRVVDGEKEENTLTSAQWSALGLEDKVNDPKVIELAKKYGDADVSHYAKLSILHDVNKMDKKDVKDKSAEEAARTKISKSLVAREVEVAAYLSDDTAKYEPIVADVFTLNNGSLEDLNKFNFDLFGIDLRDTPNFSWNIVKGFQWNWLIPLASFFAALLTGIATSKLQKKANPEAPNMMGMMLMMPLVSLFIAFGFPCAVGFYWACSSLVSGGIQVLTQIFYGPAVVNAREQAQNIVLRAKKENIKIAEVENKSAE